MLWLRQNIFKHFESIAARSTFPVITPKLKVVSDQSRTILMLEDETERLVRFEDVLRSVVPSVNLRHWRTAAGFIDGYCGFESTPLLICLDHDLFVHSADEPDPGDGRDVTEFLASQQPCCHVVIHSSNAPAADSMHFTLVDAGWDSERIAPIGQDWIESYWFPVIKPWLA